MGFRVATLKATCATLRDDLVARGVAQAAIARVWPGGEDNPKRDAWAWVRCHARLAVLRTLAERDTPAEGSSAAAADRVVLDALAATPKPITLADGRRVAAYPKSAYALIRCHEHNLALARLLTAAAQLGASEAPTAHELTARALAEAVHQHRLLAWIATTPGPGLPFAEEDTDPALPASHADLTPQDLVAICRAFDEVNWAPLRVLEALITPDPEADDEPRRRPSWSQFFALAASQEGVASERVLRDRSLAGYLATTQLAASAQREAMAEAKARAVRQEG